MSRALLQSESKGSEKNVFCQICQRVGGKRNDDGENNVLRTEQSRREGEKGRSGRLVGVS